jgi:radical SAM superfamily enzyme YgiQ (UPF0313 family)
MEVVIKDYHQGWGRKTVPLPKELKYLKEFYPEPDNSPFSTFHHYYHFGASFEILAADVAREKPDLVGISSLFSPYYREVLRCAEEIKKRIDVPILLGGSHVSAVPNLMLQHPNVDFIIRGEGERPLIEFLKSWIKKRSFEHIPNLGFKKDGALILNEIEENFSIQDLPHPDLSDLIQENYCFEKRPLTFLITSRSCPHRCSFCSVHLTFGTRYQRRSPEDVLQEMKSRYEEGIRVFDFEDDNLTFYMNEMKNLLKKIIAIFPKGDIQLVAMNGISYLSLDTELLKLMKEAGFTHLNLALVSSDQTVRETTKRPHTIEKYLTVIREAFRLNFKIVSYQILGLPNETLDSMIQTLIFGARLPILLGASMFYLTPNSPIAKNFPERTAEDILKSRLTAMAIETNQFKREDLYTLFITTRIINFLKGLRFQEKELNLRESLEWAYQKDDRSRTGAEILEKLLREKTLYAATNQGLKRLPKFKTSLFFQVWDTLGHISTLRGRTLKINPSLNEILTFEEVGVQYS